MNDNGIRVIGYLIKSHVAWSWYSANNDDCTYYAERLVDDFISDMLAS